MIPTVFISYSTKDQKVAQTICGALESRGFGCWFSGRNVGPGENFQESVVRALRAAKVMVLVFTGNANNSQEIKKEVVLAGQFNLLVIPVRVEDVAPNDAFVYEFATRQWIDMFDDWERAIERLCSQISGIIAADAATIVRRPVQESDVPPVSGTSRFESATAPDGKEGRSQFGNSTSRNEPGMPLRTATKERGVGLIGNMIVGVVGAFVGTYLTVWLGISSELMGVLLGAAVGAAILLSLVGFIKR